MGVKKKKKVDLKFVVVFNKKICQTAFTRYRGEPVLTGFQILFGEKLQRPETGYFNCDYVSEHLTF